MNCRFGFNTPSLPNSASPSCKAKSRWCSKNSNSNLLDEEWWRVEWEGESRIECLPVHQIISVRYLFVQNTCPGTWLKLNRDPRFYLPLFASGFIYLLLLLSLQETIEQMKHSLLIILNLIILILQILCNLDCRSLSSVTTSEQKNYFSLRQ